MARWRYGKVTIEVPCEGETHRVEIDKGKVTLLDHDKVSEKTLKSFIAFGATDPEEGCLGFLRWWEKDPLNLAASLGPFPYEATHAFCEECGWMGDVDDVSLDDFELDLAESLGPGWLVPAGICPTETCGYVVWLGFGPWQPYEPEPID